MQSYKYIIALLFLIGIIIVTREITIRMYKCPECPNYIIEEAPEMSVTQNFGSMFTDPIPGLFNQLLFDKKPPEKQK